MPATRLAVLRIVTGLFALWYVGVRYGMFLKIAAADRQLFEPVGVVGWMREPLSSGWFEGLLCVTLLCNLAYIVGWQYRWSGPAFAALLLALLSYRNSWSMIYHSDNAMVAQILILGCVRAADAWSVDSWRARLTVERVHWRYGWPVRLICAATTAGYFLAGVAKLAGELGLGWVSGEALRGQVAVDTIRKVLLGSEVSSLAFVLYDHLWLYTLIGVVSMVVELGAPVALLSGRLGMIWAVNALLMHWGIFAIMNITFRYQMAGIIFLAFFPVERVVTAIGATWARLRGQRAAAVAESSVELPDAATALADSHLVVFDGRCRFCVGQMRLLYDLDLLESLRFVSLHEPAAARLLPDLSVGQMMQAMIVIAPDGKRYAGAEAVRRLSTRMPLLWWLAPLLYIPGSLGFWQAGYDAVARVRYRFGSVACEEGGTCAVRGLSNAG